MALTINTPLSDTKERDALVDDVLAELTQVGMRNWVSAARRWHDGGLSLVHLNVLMLIVSTGPTPMTKLAEELDVSLASLSGIIDRMEKRGIVERRRSTTDRRVVEVFLTEHGSEQLDQLGALRRAHLATLIQDIDDDDLAAMLKGLRAFHAARERFMSTAPDEGRSQA